jgi:hypothetical protein
LPGYLVHDSLLLFRDTAWDDDWFPCSWIHATYGPSSDFLFHLSKMLLQCLDRLLLLQFFSFKKQIFQIVGANDEEFPELNLFGWYYFNSAGCKFL